MASARTGTITSDRARDYAARSHQARRVNALEQRIRELVESAPPLTPEQLDRLAVLLRPAVKAVAGERSARGAA